MERNQQTWIACLTPPGRSAIATLAVRGPQAWTAVRSLFEPARGQLPAQPEPGQFWFGRLGEDGKSGRDEVVLAVRQASGALSVEVHCHGGREVVRMLLDIFAARGIRACTWPELEALTGQDPLRRLAQIELTEAPTARTAAILLDQFHGALSTALTAIQDALANGRSADALERLEDLAAHTPLGRHLTRPWRVVIAGATNVGKSTLINALAGYQRSVVDANPGTTRDVVTTLTAIDGWPVELADTAGWRPHAEPLEQQGIALAQSAVASADLCFWILDGSVAPVVPEQRPDHVRYIINKVDLAAAWNWADEALQLSAQSGRGVAELCQALSGWLVPNPPTPGAAVPFTVSLCDQVESARRLLVQGLRAEATKTLLSLPLAAESSG